MNLNRLMGSRRDKEGFSHKRQKSREKSMDRKVCDFICFSFSFHLFG